MDVETILAALQQIIDEAKNEEGEPRDLTDEEIARYVALEAKLAQAQRSAEIIKRNAAYRTVKTGAGFKATDTHEDTYARAFENYLRTGQKNSDLISRAQGEATGSAGGFLVPDEWRDLIIEKLKAFGGLMNAAEKLNTSDGRPLSWLTNDDTTADLAEITPEAGLWDTGADLTFTTRTLGAYKYTTVGASSLPLKVSFELLQDSAFDLRGFIAKKFAQRIARKLAPHLVTGTGVNEPQGIISTQGGLTSLTARGATAIPTYAELLSAVHGIDPDYREGASWLMNDASLALMRQVVDDVDRPLLWSLNDSLSGELKGMTILGYPVVIDQAMPSMAASGGAKAIVFGNLADTYVVREVKAFEMITLNELYAQNGQVGMMGWARYDGMVSDPNAAVVLPNAT